MKKMLFFILLSISYTSLSIGATELVYPSDMPVGTKMTVLKKIDFKNNEGLSILINEGEGTKRRYCYITGKWSGVDPGYTFFVARTDRSFDSSKNFGTYYSTIYLKSSLSDKEELVLVSCISGLFLDGGYKALIKASKGKLEFEIPSSQEAEEMKESSATITTAY